MFRQYLRELESIERQFTERRMLRKIMGVGEWEENIALLFPYFKGSKRTSFLNICY